MCLLGKGLITRREAEVSCSSDRSVCGRARVTAPVCAAAGLLLHKQALGESREMKLQKRGLSFVIEVSASPGVSRMGRASKYWDNDDCFNGVFKWLERTMQRFIFV